MGKPDRRAGFFSRQRHEDRCAVRLDRHVLHFLRLHRVKDELRAATIDESGISLAAFREPALRLQILALFIAADPEPERRPLIEARPELARIEPALRLEFPIPELHARFGERCIISDAEAECEHRELRIDRLLLHLQVERDFIKFLAERFEIRQAPPVAQRLIATDEQLPDFEIQRPQGKCLPCLRQRLLHIAVRQRIRTAKNRRRLRIRMLRFICLGQLQIFVIKCFPLPLGEQAIECFRHLLPLSLSIFGRFCLYSRCQADFPFFPEKTVLIGIYPQIYQHLVHILTNRS